MYLKTFTTGERIKINQISDDFIYIGEYVICIKGTFFLGSTVAEEADLLRLYFKYGKSLYKWLDGYGTVVIFNIKTGIGCIHTDIFNSPYFVFYYNDKSSLCISDDIFQIIGNLPGIGIDTTLTRRFISFGYIPGSKTLVKGIKKLQPRHWVDIDVRKGKIKHRKCCYSFQRKKVTEEAYLSCFKNSVACCVSKNARVTLSGGYDSNFILWNLVRYNDCKSIDAYCIGGVFGRDETKTASAIAASYGNVSIHKSFVSPSTLNHFPEIILALQGQIYDKGVFLQYELGKLVASENGKTLLSGDCADQVMAFNSFRVPIIASIGHMRQIILKHIIYHFCPYDAASNVILKKNGLIMKHFGINTSYPYLRRDFIDIAQSIAIFGDFYKKKHISIVSRNLPNSIQYLLKKTGGSTDGQSLLGGDFQIALLEGIAKDSIYWAKPNPIVKKYNYLDFLLKIISLDIFEKLLKWKSEGQLGIPLMEDLYPINHKE